MRGNLSVSLPILRTFSFSLPLTFILHLYREYYTCVLSHASRCLCLSSARFLCRPNLNRSSLSDAHSSPFTLLFSFSRSPTFFPYLLAPISRLAPAISITSRLPRRRRHDPSTSVVPVLRAGLAVAVAQRRALSRDLLSLSHIVILSSSVLRRDAVNAAPLFFLLSHSSLPPVF